MTQDHAELHDQLRAVARDLLGKTRPETGQSGEMPADWQLLARSGWLGLEVPESLEGSGASFAEVAVILEEMGRAATRSPYLGTAVLGVGALNLLEPNQGRDALLRLMATGDRVVAVALSGGEGDTVDVAPPFRLERWSDGWRLHGRASFVVDAPDADRLLLLAQDPDGTPVLAVVHVPPEASAGLATSDQPLLDATRRVGTVTADGVEVDEAAVWRFAQDPKASVRRLLDRGAVAVAADSLGLSEAMLEATVAYAGVREQFGRPIGSFQAVKHACADMLVQISVGRELLAAAVRAVATDDPEASTAVSRAKSYVCSAAVDVVGKSLQLHGGVGYTWESGIHAYLKRAALNRSIFGSPRAHRSRLAESLVVPGHP